VRAVAGMVRGHRAGEVPPAMDDRVAGGGQAAVVARRRAFFPARRRVHVMGHPVPQAVPAYDTQVLSGRSFR